MYRIESDLYPFIQAIRNRQTMVLEPTGQWSIESSWKDRLTRFVGVKECNILSLAKAFMVCLDHLEAVPVRFHAMAQSVDFHAYLLAGKAIKEALSTSSSVKAVQIKQQLQYRLIGLRYRLESVNGGLDPVTSDEDLVVSLMKAAGDWKKNQTVFLDPSLSEKDSEKLQHVCGYQVFAIHLLQDVSLQDRFFTCVLRDNNPVEPFVEYPGMQERIKACNLQSRIGRHGGKGLNIVKIPSSRMLEKHLTLPFEGTPISILDDERVVTFKGNYPLSIRQIFEIFRNKDYDIGNVEFMADGIINWNTYRMALWDDILKAYQPIDLNQAEWWKQLPCFELITEEEGLIRYGVELNGKDWIVAPTATRTSPNLDFENTHAFFEVAIPIGQHKYQVYHFGKFGIYMLATLYEQMAGFCETVPAVISYPDLNVFYTHRQTTCCPFILHAQSGIDLMEAIKQDILKGRQGNFVYQVESENCAKWTHEILVSIVGSERVPNLYKMPLLDTHPVGLVARIFRFVKTLPTKIQVRVLTSLHLLFGAWRGTWIHENGCDVWKSLLTHEFWETAEVYLPALLVEQKVNGTLAFVLVKEHEEGTHVELPPISTECAPLENRYCKFKRLVGVFVSAGIEFFFTSTDNAIKRSRRSPGLSAASFFQNPQGLFVSNSS